MEFKGEMMRNDRKPLIFPEKKDGKTMVSGDDVPKKTNPMNDWISGAGEFWNGLGELEDL